jgi:uncharacterized membrane protein (UPF0127 family)
MPRARAAAVAAVLALTSGCGDGKADGRAAVVIDTGERTVTVRAEVADTPGERARGLMGRETLPRDAGMVFTYERETTGGYWMKNTLIPLSIAFYGGDGEILRILDLKPCRGDPCPVYDPGVSYRGALEVNAGAFARLGVEEGDTLRVDVP